MHSSVHRQNLGETGCSTLGLVYWLQFHDLLGSDVVSCLNKQMEIYYV